ncbi:MAG: hypothetical protein M1170_00340 [Patescibacteria group bacterium]|nr:hypothetical protein [Patescibacteria group bacterium]
MNSNQQIDFEAIVFDLDGTVLEKRFTRLQDLISLAQANEKMRWISRVMFFLYEVFEFLAVVFFGMKFKINPSAQRIITKKSQIYHINKEKPLALPDWNMVIMTNRSLLGVLSLVINGFPLYLFSAVQVRKSVLNYFVDLKALGIEPQKVLICDEIKPHRDTINEIKNIYFDNSKKIVLIDDDVRVRNLARERGMKIATMKEVADAVC